MVSRVYGLPLSPFHMDSFGRKNSSCMKITGNIAIISINCMLVINILRFIYIWAMHKYHHLSLLRSITLCLYHMLSPRDLLLDLVSS